MTDARRTTATMVDLKDNADQMLATGKDRRYVVTRLFQIAPGKELPVESLEFCGFTRDELWAHLHSLTYDGYAWEHDGTRIALAKEPS